MKLTSSLELNDKLQRTKKNENERMFVRLFVGSVIFIRNDGMAIRNIVFVDFFIFCSLNRLICEKLMILITKCQLTSFCVKSFVTWQDVLSGT